MPGKPITLEDVEKARSGSPRRQRFADWPIVKKRPDGTYVVSTKFMGIDRLFEMETGLDTVGGPYGPYAFLSDEKQIKRALEWQEARKTLVFLRDALHCSIAMDLNLEGPGVYTALGQAEHDAKANQDAKSVKLLAAKCQETIEGLGLYCECDAICAVPPSPNKDWDLPTQIVERIADKTGLDDLSSQVAFGKEKQSIKSVPLADKWATLGNAKLKATTKFKGLKVILVDDKYQSGTTIQFVASKLLEAGAEQVLGLSCVKTWRDTDNT